MQAVDAHVHVHAHVRALVVAQQFQKKNNLCKGLDSKQDKPFIYLLGGSL